MGAHQLPTAPGIGRGLLGWILAAALVAGLVVAGPAAPTSAAPVPPDYAPLTKPARVLDTRASAMPGPGSILRVTIPGSPAAAMLNVVATDPRSSGYLTVWACDAPRPGTSSVNFAAGGAPVAALAFSAVSSGGQVCLFTSAATHIVVDLFGTTPRGSAVRAVQPVRAIDTRTTPGKPAAGSVTRISLAGVAGIGSRTPAVVASLTVTQPASAGWAAISSCDAGWAGTSTVNLSRSGTTRANAAIVAVGATAEVCVRVSTASHIIVDITGRAEPGAQLHANRQQRLVDTRQATGPTGAGRVAADSVVRVPNILTGSQAVSVNVTVTGASGRGWARVWLCSRPEPATSNLNFAGPAAVANAAVTLSAPDGPLCVRVAGAAAHVVVDAMAAFARQWDDAPLADRADFGAWVDGMIAEPARFTARERTLGTRFDIASYFFGYGDWFPTDIERRFADGGTRDVLISWDMGRHRFREWSAGAHDAYLRTIGRLAAQYPYPIYVRPWPEMNGDWQPYQPTARGQQPYGGTPAEFVSAWRHVVDTVRAAGGTRVRWVFNPYAATYPGATDVRSLWPGRGYVDVLGMDGYNWGGGPAPWQSFGEVFAGIYSELSALDPALPIWVCETASREPAVDDGAVALPGESKRAWVADMFAQQGFSRIEALVWFDERKERDWRFDSSPGALAAFRGAL